MKNIMIDGYKRITKATARKLYNSSDGFNNTIARNKAFETVVNAFIYYNCNYETGYYPAFYIKEV